MITDEQVIPSILSVCPSFLCVYEASDDKELPYCIMGELAHHLMGLQLRKETGEFEPLCEVIERFHVDGVPTVRELATIGLLESIQNVWGNNSLDPEIFRFYLLPESQNRWDELNDFWKRIR